MNTEIKNLQKGITANNTIIAKIEAAIKVAKKMRAADALDYLLALGFCRITYRTRKATVLGNMGGQAWMLSEQNGCYQAEIDRIQTEIDEAAETEAIRADFVLQCEAKGLDPDDPFSLCCV